MYIIDNYKINLYKWIRFVILTAFFWEFGTQLGWTLWDIIKTLLKYPVG